MDTQIFITDNDYIEVYESDEVRLYTTVEGVTVDTGLTPRQARQLARLLLQFADDAEG